MSDIIPGENYNPYDFIWTLSYVFGTIFVVGPLLVPRGPDRDLYQISIMQSALYMWIAWVTVYSSQMHPIQGPTFKNTTLAWLSYSWGNSPGIEPMSLPTTTTTPTEAPTTTTTVTTSTTTTTMTTTTTVTTPTTTFTTTTVTTTTATPEPEPYFLKNYKASFNPGTGWTPAFLKVCHSYRCDGRGLSKSINLLLIDAFPLLPDKVMFGNISYIIDRPSWGKEGTPSKAETYNLVSATTWRPFWVEWTQDPTSGRGYTMISIGIVGQREAVLRHRGAFYFPIAEIQFLSRCDSEWLILSGLVIPPKSEKIGIYGLRKMGDPPKRVVEKLRTYTDVVNMTDAYKYYIVRDEPIQLSVFLGRHLWREFFILLSSEYKKRVPRILIHIGEHYGEYCNIAKNGIVVVRVRCDLEWRRDTYLQFWIWFKNGKISVKSGYYTPGPYKAFLSWNDTEPFKVNLFAVRTIITEEIPMTVVDTVVEDWVSV